MQRLSLGIAVCMFLLIIPLHSGAAQFSANLGWISLMRGWASETDVQEDDLLAAQQWFDQIATRPPTHYHSYGWCLAALGLLESDGIEMWAWFNLGELSFTNSGTSFFDSQECQSGIVRH